MIVGHNHIEVCGCAPNGGACPHTVTKNIDDVYYKLGYG